MLPGNDVLTSLHADDLVDLEALLARLHAEANVRCVLLVDRTGHLLAAAGDTADLDRTTFASLAAADFGASDQLASLLGEREFASLYHHGESHSMVLAALGGWAILAALFDNRLTSLGMVRLKLKGLIPEFVARFDQLRTRSRARGPALESGWAADAESEVDRLFSEG